MKEKTKELIRMLSETFEGDPWYGDSVMRQLENVPYKVGYKSCIPDSHSVAQIVGHLISWKKFALAKLKKDKDCEIEIDSKKDWPPVTVNSQEAWEDLKKELVAIQSKIYEFLNNKPDDSYLEEKVEGKDYDFAYLIRGILQHDIYHIGQIGLISSQFKKSETDAGIFKA
ncbi:DinB family protein [Christiangramia aquimixticola]|uniref:DinB family protein n=1 Tax=Christiangramia aquimixticola TaxID=1697558 RepID=UPI003AA8F319